MTVINTAPTLITERLRLDAHTLDDFDSLAALWVIRWWCAISAARRATGKTPGGA